MGETVEVDAGGLHIHATLCDAVASAVAESPMAEPPSGLDYQRTVAAVADGHDALTCAASRLAARVTATGAALRTAAAAYTSTDSGSAQNLAAISQSVEA